MDGISDAWLLKQKKKCVCVLDGGGDSCTVSVLQYHLVTCALPAVFFFLRVICHVGSECCRQCLRVCLFTMSDHYVKLGQTHFSSQATKSFRPVK